MPPIDFKNSRKDRFVFNYVLPVFLVLILLIGAILGERINNESQETALRAEVQHQMSAVRDRLEGNLNSNLQLVRGLISVIALEPGLNQAQLEIAAAPLFQGRTQLRNIGAAPDMVIRLMYPIAGNEKAIGLDFRKTPTQVESAEKARSTRQIILAGPLRLAQGGIGLVARMPVYLPEARGESRFWGLVSAVIDIDRLYNDSGLIDARMPIEIAIRGRDASGPQGEGFFGKPEIFSNKPILREITLPYGSWPKMSGYSVCFSLWLPPAFLAPIWPLPMPCAGHPCRRKLLKRRVQHWSSTSCILKSRSASAQRNWASPRRPPRPPTLQKVPSSPTCRMKSARHSMPSAA